MEVLATAATVVAIATAAILALVGNRSALNAITRRALDKGYRGPFVQIGTTLLWIACLEVGYYSVVLGFDVPDDGGFRAGAVVVGSSAAFVLAAGWTTVLLLPRKSLRAAGPRHTSFPYAWASVTSSALAFLLPVLLIVLGRPVAESIQFTAVFSVFAGWLGVQARHARARQAHHPSQLVSGAPPVLLLRGFAAESQRFADRRPPGPRSWLRSSAVDPDANFFTAERFLEPAVRKRLGPLVGLGNPTDHLPPDGMLRYYASDDEWRGIVRALLPETRAVLVLAGGATTSLEWELLHLRLESTALTRTFVLVPPVSRRRSGWSTGAGSPVDWELFRYRMRTFGYVVPTVDPGPGTVIGFDERGSGSVLVSAAESADEYAAAVARSLAERTVRSARVPAEAPGKVARRRPISRPHGRRSGLPARRRPRS